MGESKTAGCEMATPAVGSVKGNDSTPCQDPPVGGGVLKRTFWDEMMVVIFFRASFLDFGTDGLFYWRGECLSSNFQSWDVCRRAASKEAFWEVVIA
jgi:hypothetical protein